MPNAPNSFSWLPFPSGVLGNNSPLDAPGGSAVEAVQKIRAWFAEEMKSAGRNGVKIQLPSREGEMAQLGSSVMGMRAFGG